MDPLKWIIHDGDGDGKRNVQWSETTKSGEKSVLFGSVVTSFCPKD